MARFTDHLKTKADDYRSVLSTAADGDLTARVEADSQSEAMAAAERGETASGTTETVVDSIQEIADGSDDQRRQLSEAADRMSTLSATVEEMASSVTDLADRSDETADLGRDARDLTSHAADALVSIEHQVTDAVEEVEQLSKLSEQVAAETNTLALNGYSCASTTAMLARFTIS